MVEVSGVAISLTWTCKSLRKLLRNAVCLFYQSTVKVHGWGRGLANTGVTVFTIAKLVSKERNHVVTHFLGKLICGWLRNKL